MKEKTDWHKLFLYGVIVIACWVLFSRECKCKPPPMEPKPTQTIKEQEKAAVDIEAIRKRDADSFNLVLKSKDDLVNKYFNNWQQTDIKLTQAERAVDDLLNDETIPDTCDKYVANIQNGFNIVKDAYAKKDAQALNTIIALKSVTQTQKQFLVNKDSAYAKMKNAFDTCIASVKYYKEQSDKKTPHNKLAIGPQAIVYPTFWYGVTAAFIHKKGIVISLSGGLTLNNTFYEQVGILKVISFRK